MTEVERQLHRSVEVKLAFLADGGASIIEEMAELNADHEYTYSDDDLIEMLKEATAEQRKD